MQAEIVAIGTELLLGEIVDTNSTHIARVLRDIGLDVHYMSTVGDNEMRVSEVLRTALARADVIITTGGLGPTVDDVTRQAIAAATDRPLVFKQELLDQIAERFKRFGAKMGENNRQQAFVPQAAIAIENPVGTAPVFIVDDGQKVVIALPGVPREMKHLLDSDILPWLKERLGLAETIIKALVLRTAGIGESRIDQQITDLMKGSNPTVGLAAHTAQVDVRITAKAASEAEADALIAPVEEEIRKRLGDTVYGTGALSLEDALVSLCSDKGVTLASCEAGIGETLVGRLTKAADSSLYTGGSSFQNDTVLAQHYTIDPHLPVTKLAEAAANACRLEQRTTLGIAAIVRPMQESDAEGHSGTAIAVAGEDGTRSHYYAYGTDRLNAPIWATTHALAMARNTVLKQFA